MKPLQRARGSLRTAREGTARTARWFGGGIASGPRRLATALRRDGSPEGGEAAPPERGPAGPSKLGEASSADRGPGPIARLRASDRHLGLWVAGALLVAAWIGWAAYIWTENGVWSGVGVLISWPAVLAALAVLTSPVWATWLLRRERRSEAASEEAPDGAVEAGVDRA